MYVYGTFQPRVLFSKPPEAEYAFRTPTRVRVLFDNLLVRIHTTKEMIWWGSLVLWEFNFHHPSLIRPWFVPASN